MLLSVLIAFFPMVHNAQEVAGCLPMSESSIETVVEESITQFQEKLDQFLAIPAEKRTFDNTIRSWDFLSGGVQQTIYCLEGFMQIYPEKSMRDCADKACQKLEQTVLNTMAAHPEIYTACLNIEKAYVQAILSKGGSRDPDQMLVDFLGREPSLEPFFSQLVERQDRK